MELSTKEYKKGLSKRESFLISSLARQDKTVFSIEDAKRVVKENAKKSMHSLIEKKWVLPLKRGLYAIVPMDVGVKGADSFIMHNFVIASFLAKPYYIGYWSALNHYGFSEQIPRSTFVATTRIVKPLNILNCTYYFVKLVGRKFFGIRKIEIEKHKVNISDPDKTIADCLDHPEHSGGIDELARAIYFSHGELDFVRIKEYAMKMGNMTILKRLGYILDKTDLLENYEGIFRGFRASKGYPLLDTISPKKGKYDAKWNLLVNCKISTERWMY